MKKDVPGILQDFLNFLRDKGLMNNFFKAMVFREFFRERKKEVIVLRKRENVVTKIKPYGN